MAKLDMSFLPDGISGVWEITSFTVGKEISQLLSIMQTGRGVPAGNYKKLSRGGIVVMSNTPDEIRDFLHFTSTAKGSVLINGLGLGCVVKVLLDKPEIKKITVIEQSKDVIRLVSPYFTDSRLEIIHADAFTYEVPKDAQYDAVWHDIWDNICGDNIKEMNQLHKKYKKHTQWQDSWAKKLCQKHNREEKKWEKTKMFLNRLS